MTGLRRWKEGAVIHAGGADGNDYTLCCYALEGEASEGGEPECVEVTRGKINCDTCVTIIRHCKTIPARLIATPPKQRR